LRPYRFAPRRGASDPRRNALGPAVAAQPLQSFLAPETRAAVAAERHLDAAGEILVDARLPGLEVPRQPSGRGEVAGEHAGDQSVIRPVGKRQRFRDVDEHRHAQDRAEDLLLHCSAGARNGIDDRRLEESVLARRRTGSGRPADRNPDAAVSRPFHVSVDARARCARRAMDASWIGRARTSREAATARSIHRASLFWYVACASHPGSISTPHPGSLGIVTQPSTTV
jgi:hypothetical protein